MTPRDIIEKNIKFQNPERIGLRFNALGVSDVHRIYVQHPGNVANDSSGEISMAKKRKYPDNIDEWGCKWENVSGVEESDMGQVLDPPIKHIDQAQDYPFPDPYDPKHFPRIEETLALSGEKFVQLNSPFCLFERLHFLRGFEDSLCDLALEPEKSAKLLDAIIGFQIGIAEMAGKLGGGRIHCFDTTDDWGTQAGMFISPKMWRQAFKPRYKKLIDTVHDNGMYFRFHSDGKINPILEDLVEIGVDILNIHQPLLIGFDEIREKLRGKVCLEVSVDIQATLPYGIKEDITNQVKKIIDNCCTPAGGLIGVEYRRGKAVGISQQALEYELAAFQKFGSL